MAYSRKKDLGVNQNFLGEKYEFVNIKKPIGEGGSGLVYKANQIFDKDSGISIPRAVKFFVYKEKLVSKLGYVSNENFETEIVNITRFNHQNILKVIDGDYIDAKLDGKPYRVPYTVTEFIDGYTLVDFFENDKCKNYIKCEDDIFEIFSQIAQGLSYLHSNDFFHCDIAPKNIYIKIDESSRCFAVIGDLGAGRTITPEKTGSVLVIGTSEYMPQEALKFKDKKIEYKKFAELQPSWDIYSFIKTIRYIVEKAKEKKYLDDTWHLDRLIEKTNETDYSSIIQINKDIELLRPSCNKVMNLDELSEASNSVRQVLIPLYPVVFSKRMYELSKHSMLLRLMDVSELLEGATTFPGANHTRYEHSLGTYELMRKAILALLRNKSYAIFFDERTVLIGLISALLSSIFNFPLSYAAIELCSQQKGLLGDFSNRRIFRHLIDYKVNANETSIFEAISKSFGAYRIEIVDLEYVIFGKDSYQEEDIKLEVLNKLLNSSVGVRIIDYMMRDSFHIGLKYRVDIDSLFSFMSIEKNMFCLGQAGIAAAEQVIINRYWMFKRVYWSEPNRANVALLKYLFYLSSNENFTKNLLAENAYNSREELKKYLIKNSNKTNRAKIKDILAFIDQKGKNRYKRLLVIGSSDPLANNLWRDLVRKTYSEQETIRRAIEIIVIDYLSKKKKKRIKAMPKTPVILLDVPYENNSRKLGSDVNVIRHSGGMEALSKASATVGRMFDSFNDQLALLRIYIRPDIYDEYIYSPRKDEEKAARKEIESLVLRKLRYCTKN